MNAGPVRHTYRVRGLELAYHTWGDRARPAILLIHGFQDHGQSYARIARLLAGEYFLAAPDLRGHGESDWVGAGGDYYFYDYVFDVMRMIEVLEIETLAIVGHSMGGNVATFTTALLKERVSRLVLLEGMGFGPHNLAETVHRLVRWSTALRRKEIDAAPEERRMLRPRMNTLEEAATRLMRYNERLPRDHALELANTFSEPAPDGQGLMWRFDPLHKTPSAKPYVLDEAKAIWRALSMPVLSIYGSASPWFPTDIESRLSCIQDVRSAIVEGSGHNIHHDLPEILAQTVDGFLRDPRAPFPLGVRSGVPSPT